jgi:hypothetical protein
MTSRSTLLCLALLSATACSEEPECPPIEACDIRDSGCHDRALRIAACMRDADPESVAVAVEVIDADVYIDEAVRQASEGGDTTTPRERAFKRALVMLDMADEVASAATDTRAHLEQVGAFYRSSTKQITVLDRGDPLDDNGSMSLLVHEMVHALQDQEQAFDSIAKAKNWDMWLARRAMTEGDAEWVQLQTLAELDGYARERIDWVSYFARFQSNMLELAAESTDLFRDSSMLFPYAWGGAFVRKVHDFHGQAGVLGLFAENAPDDTLAVMLSDSDRVSDAFHGRAVPKLEDTWALNSVSHLGSWLAQRFVERQDLGWETPSITADALSVFDGPSKADVPPTAAYWRFELTSASDAEWFALELEESRGAQSTFKLGREVWVRVQEPSLAPIDQPLAWAEQEGDDLYFKQEEEASTALPEHVRLGCATQSANLPSFRDHLR